MCEVGSCCGCVCLYKGCMIVGGVTILVSALQFSIFSLMLFESYESSSRSSSINATADLDSEPSSYYFTSTSSLCPFGFHPLVVTNEASEVPLEPSVAPSEDIALPSTFFVNESLLQFNLSRETTKTVSCLAPPQGVLVALVVTSALYAPVGIILIIGVKQCISCLLSTWFFYTVGYNLLALIIALTDGVYVGAGDVSSYVVCIITAYCVIVVDSYYEKLLRNEKALTTAKEASRPSLVVVKSSPHSPSSPQMVNVPLGKCPQLDEAIAEPSSLLLPTRIKPSQVQNA